MAKLSPKRHRQGLPSNLSLAGRQGRGPSLTAPRRGNRSAGGIAGCETPDLNPPAANRPGATRARLDEAGPGARGLQCSSTTMPGQWAVAYLPPRSGAHGSCQVSVNRRATKCTRRVDGPHRRGLLASPSSRHSALQVACGLRVRTPAKSTAEKSTYITAESNQAVGRTVPPSR